jgi:Tol biopolymer transport system component
LSSLDDRLRHEVDELAGAVPPGEVRQVAARKRRVHLLRRLQVATLVVVVIAATAGGTWGLTRAFRNTDVEPAATRPSVRNGKIAFVRSQRRSSRGTAPPNVFVMDPDGANVTRVSDDNAHMSSLDWSPDGTRLAFVRGRDIWVMNADGSGLTVLTSNERGQDDFPDWSPDGTRIAFTRSEQFYCDSPGCREPSEEMMPHIYVMNADGSEIRQLTTGLWYEHDPTWSPDGTLIAFMRSKADIEGLNPPGFSPGAPTPPVVYVVAPDGGGRIGTEASELTRMDPSAQGLEWSPDGKRFLFTARGGIYTMDMDGTPQVIPIRGQGPDGLIMWGPIWSPDGSKIAFAASRGTDDDIYTVNADGSGLTQLTNTPDEDAMPAWQPIPQGAPTVEPSPPGPDAIQPEREAAAEQALLRALTEVFGPLCGMSSVVGDFDGDGGPDLAAVSYGSADGFCRGPATQAIPAWSLYVMWATGSSGVWPLPECARICQSFAAANLDSIDGSDELFVVTEGNASTQFLRVFALPASDAGPIRLTVAEPGTERHPGGEALVLEYGGSPTHQAFVTCQPTPSAYRWPFDRLIATTADLSEDESTWTMHETVFGYPSVIVNGEDPNLRLVRVLSSRTYEVPFDPTGQEPLSVPGEPCWVLD